MGIGFRYVFLCCSLGLPSIAAETPAATPNVAVVGKLPLSFERDCESGLKHPRYRVRGPGQSARLQDNGELTMLAPNPVKLHWAGARGVSPLGQASDRMSGRKNTFVGTNPSAWCLNAVSYSQVEYTQLYPGIDLNYYGTSSGALEYDLIIHPGASISAIRLSIEGVQDAGLDAAGNLILHTDGTLIHHLKPAMYQTVQGRRRPVEGSYVIHKDGQIGFRAASYDRDLTLVIDPVIAFSTLLGGTGFDAIHATAVDSAGFIYVAGETSSTTFSHGSQRSSRDLFVSKLSADGSRAIYTTVIGGAGNDTAQALALDSSGNVYVTGITSSADFPTTLGALKRTLGGVQDAFVCKLDVVGTLVYSTYLGAAGEDAGTGIAVDLAGEAHVTGYTSSAGFPVTAGAVRQTYGGGAYDGFVAKLNAAGSGLIYATFLGGGGTDLAQAIAVDPSGNAYVAGYTNSPDYPVANAVQSTNLGDYDGFVTKLNAFGSALLFSTYLGGSGVDQANAIALDSDLNILVSGITSSVNFPVTPSAYQSSNRGSYDAFCAKLRPAGNAFVFSTYVGGSGTEVATSLAVSPGGNVIIAGFTNSADFPLADAAQSSLKGATDAFLAVLDVSGSQLKTSTFFGGAADDRALALAVAGGSAYIAGFTFSSDFPTQNGLQPVSNGGAEGFLAQIVLPIDAVVLPTSPSAAVASLTPVASSGVNQTFTVGFSALAGWQPFDVVNVLINNALDGRGACYMGYSRPTNTLYLVDDLTGTLLPGLVLDGSAGSVGNSQCTVNRIGSSATSTAAGLTLTLSIAFNASFGGNKVIYAAARDKVGSNSGWVSLGMHSVPPLAAAFPKALGVSPSSGSTNNGLLTFTYQDQTDANNLQTVWSIVHTEINGAGACYIAYYRPGNLLLLIPNNGDSSQATSMLLNGGNGSLSNSQCTIFGAGSSASTDGDQLALTLDVKFSSSFAGRKIIWLASSTLSGQASKWEALGAWVVK